MTHLGWLFTYLTLMGLAFCWMTLANSRAWCVPQECDTSVTTQNSLRKKVRHIRKYFFSREEGGAFLRGGFINKSFFPNNCRSPIKLERTFNFTPVFQIYSHTILFTSNTGFTCTFGCLLSYSIYTYFYVQRKTGANVFFIGFEMIYEFFWNII